jgi:hypothetical protein
MRRALAAAAAFAVFVSPSASGKDGAQAHLLAPFPLHASAGALITVRWTVDVPGARGRVPFGAIGMFTTLVGAHSPRTTAAAAQTHGPYSVRIRVPIGGIRHIQIGLRGFAVEANGTTRPAPMLFPITNSPFSHNPIPHAK